MTHLCLVVTVGGWILFWIQFVVQVGQVYAVVVSRWVWWHHHKNGCSGRGVGAQQPGGLLEVWATILKESPDVQRVTRAYVWGDFGHGGASSLQYLPWTSYEPVSDVTASHNDQVQVVGAWLHPWCLGSGLLLVWAVPAEVPCLPSSSFQIPPFCSTRALKPEEE